MIHNLFNGPEKESKDKPISEPEPRTNSDKDKSDPRKKDPNAGGKT